MSLDARQIVDAVAARGGIDPNAAEKAVGSILSILHHEAAAEIDPVMARVPGSAQLAQAYDVMSPQASGQSPGIIGTFIAALGSGLGEKTGALVNGMRALQSNGLTPAQLQQAGSVLVHQLETAAGPASVDRALASVPGLKGSLGF